MHDKTKHFEVKFRWTRSFVGEGDKAFITMVDLRTLSMLADILTKVMSAGSRQVHFKHLMGQEVKTSASFQR